MPLPIRILVRTDIDWSRMDADGFQAQDDPTRPLTFIRSPAATAALALWDRVYDLDFFAYRGELQRIAYGTFAAVGADAVTRGFADFERWWDEPGDEIVVPMDDDDWLYPQLPEIAGHFVDGIDVVLWYLLDLGIDDDGAMAWRSRILPCVFPNNFAVRKSFLQTNFTAEDAKAILAHHSTANERLADLFGIGQETMTAWGHRPLHHPRVVHLHGHQSLKITHVGSLFVLVDTMRRDDPVRFLRAIDLRTPQPLPASAEVVAAELDELDQVWAALRSDSDRTA